MSSLSKLTRRGHRTPVIYLTEGKPVTLGELCSNYDEIVLAIDGSLLVVEELEKYCTDGGHNFSQLLLAKLALQYAMRCLDCVAPTEDKKGRSLSFNRETRKYELE